MIAMMVSAVDAFRELSKDHCPKPSLDFDTELDTYEMVLNGNEWYWMGNVSFSSNCFLARLSFSLPREIVFHIPSYSKSG